MKKTAKALGGLEKGKYDSAEELKHKIVKLLKKVELPELKAGLRSQIDNFLFSISNIEGRRGKKFDSESSLGELAMTYYKLNQFIYSRDQRIEDIKSPEVQEAIAIKKRLFPFGVPKLSICIDGRVLSKLIAGLYGNALRTPAGDNPIEFLPKRGGGGLFLKKGKFTAVLDEAFENSDSLFEVLDSHLACAAGEFHARERRGEKPADHGLYDDVVRKKYMAAAMSEYAEAKYGSKKHLLTFQISFDPHNGFCFFGLCADRCLGDRRAVENGFTAEVLAELLKEGKIISTEDLVKSSKPLRDIFAKHYFAIDYIDDYRGCTNRFWTNIKEMSGDALPLVEEKLRRVFPELKSKKKSAELLQQALFVLANAYNGFLHNYDDRLGEKSYPYALHNESVVVVTYSEKGPFDRANSFSVTPNNPNLSVDVEFGSRLIRGNREAGRISKYEIGAVQEIYGKNRQKDYVKNPVITIFFERLAEELPAEEIRAIQSVDWSDLPEIDWMNMSDSAFLCQYLNKKLPNIPAIIAERINSLRNRAIEIYQPGKPATEAYLEGRLVPVWTLSGPNRETIALFPFLTKGY